MKIVGVFGFNTPYAARLHEGIDMNFKEPSAGAKYLESKMSRNKYLYKRIITEVIRKGLSNGGV